MPQPPAHRARARRAARARCPATWSRQPWDRDEVHQVFDALEFRVLRDRLYATVDHGRAGGRARASRSTARCSARGELARLARATHAPAAGRTGVHIVRHWGAGTGDVAGVALATADGERRAWFDPAELDPTDEQAFAAWLADPERPKALHDAKGPMLALRRARLDRCAGVTSDTALSAYLARPDQRSYDLADLALRYLKRELRAEDDGPGRPAHLRCARPRGRDRGGRGRHACARAPSSSSRTALDTDLEAMARRPCCATWSCRWSRCSPRWSAPASPSTPTTWARSRRTSAAAVKDAADEAFAVIGKEINLGSPKQLQVVLFDELGMPKTKRTKTGYTTDADALQALFAETAHPFLSALLSHRDVDPAQEHRRGPAQVRRRRRAHPHHVQPDDRGHRPAVVDRAQPAEHPDPHRGGPAHPARRSSSATGYESLHDRRLQPDRDADHGPPVGGRRPDRGVPVGRGPARLHRRRGSSGSRRPTSRSSSAPRSRRCPTAWPTACRRSACPGS